MTRAADTIPLPYAGPATTTTSADVDRRVAWLLFIGSLLVYAYFFQGQGYNQNAQLDTIRAIVERQTFEITAFARPGGPLTFTGDIYDVNGRVFSNKPPGMAIVGAPVYAILAGVERAMGLSLNDLAVVRFNAYVLAVVLSALPGAWVVVAMYRHLRDNGFDPPTSSLAAAGLAFGTLLFPYAGVLMAHNLLAACLFVPWTWITRRTVSIRRATLAGLLVGVGVATFLPVAPVAALYPIELLRRRLTRQAIAFCAGPALTVVGMLAYNAHHYGSPFETGARIGGEPFYEARLLLGYFDVPDFRRLYWISIHPFRGLFYSCPLFILCLLSLLKPDRAWLRSNVIPALIVGWFILFYLTFNGWAGGFSVGPRYAIPALPFLLLFALPAMQRYRGLAIALVALSTINMLALTAYNVMAPGNSVGPALNEDPVAESFKRMTMNWVARSSESYNLGMRVGIKGVPSIIPAVAMLGAFFYFLRRLTSEAPSKPSSAAPNGRLGSSR
ncbi:MAG: hypothetical protein WBD40_06000 [Tepidisphaeraceae bacterium]